MPDMTPRHYTHNNPLNRIDPDGKSDILLKIAKLTAHVLATKGVSEAIEARKINEELEVSGRIGNNADDAWRHASWSKESSETVGFFLTSIFGYLHEADNYTGFHDLIMVIVNNKKGRSLAGKDNIVENSS